MASKFSIDRSPYIASVHRLLARRPLPGEPPTPTPGCSRVATGPLPRGTSVEHQGVLGFSAPPGRLGVGLRPSAFRTSSAARSFAAIALPKDLAVASGLDSASDEVPAAATANKRAASPAARSARNASKRFASAAASGAGRGRRRSVESDNLFAKTASEAAKALRVAAAPARSASYWASSRSAAASSALLTAVSMVALSFSDVAGRAVRDALR